jgi:hypothetical protein
MKTWFHPRSAGKHVQGAVARTPASARSESLGWGYIMKSAAIHKPYRGAPPGVPLQSGPRAPIPANLLSRHPTIVSRAHPVPKG